MASGTGDAVEVARDDPLELDGTGERRIVTIALLLAMAVAALEQTVVSTAMPTIIARLRGLEIYPWVFSAYLLAATVSTPLYGKLADLLGRRRVLLFGLGLFSLGSMLSGLAVSMPMLIAMRVVQGLGAGALGPIVLTMIGDMYTLEERAKVQGLFSGIWGGSSLIGPFLGGVLTDSLSWRWVFFVTVPFCMSSFWILAGHVRERPGRREVPPIDWRGATQLASGSTLLLLAVLRGHDGAWPLTAGLLATALVLIVALVREERRAADPVLPPDLVMQPVIAVSIAGSFLVGGLLFGLDTYIPLYVQGVLGGSATAAGRTITPMFLAWAISVAVAAKVVVRLGFRATAVVGSALIASGTLALAVGSQYPRSAGPIFAAAMVVIGLGFGPTSLSQILAVQNSVAWGRRGVATGAVTFFRTMGGALCVGLLGAALGYGLGHRLAVSGAVGIDVAAALRPETHKLLGAEQLAVVQAALGRSLRDSFLQMFALAVAGVLCSFGLPAGRAVSRVGDSGEVMQDDGLALAAAAEI